MPRVLFAFPTAWDRRQLESCRREWEGRFDVVFAEPDDAGCPADLDFHAWLDAQAREHGGRIDGVLSTSDYPGATLAAALAKRLGLPGPDPARVLACSHKHASRLLQREIAPDATPRFDLLDVFRPPDPPSMGFPCFVKPVKGAYSVLARRVDSLEELRAFLASEPVQEYVRHYLSIFHRMARDLAGLDGAGFLAEELLSGEMATVEGFSTPDGEAHAWGVTDSGRDPATNSFVRFDCPSALAEDVLARMVDVARRVVRRAGLSSTFWNVETIHDPSRGAVHVIEANPRLCGQFADLHAKVAGASTYPAAMALACGEAVRRPRRAGAYAAAASFPLRVFSASRVVHAPCREDLRAAEALFPQTLVWSEVETGRRLDDFDRFEDGRSCRYAIVNLGGADRAELDRRLDAVRARLGFSFEPTG